MAKASWEITHSTLYQSVHQNVWSETVVGLKDFFWPSASPWRVLWWWELLRLWGVFHCDQLSDGNNASRVMNKRSREPYIMRHGQLTPQYCTRNSQSTWYLDDARCAQVNIIAIRDPRWPAQQLVSTSDDHSSPTFDFIQAGTNNNQQNGVQCDSRPHTLLLAACGCCQIPELRWSGILSLCVISWRNVCTKCLPSDQF